MAKITFHGLAKPDDPIFKQGMQQLFNFERLPEYLLRLVLILLLGYYLVGVYLHALLPSRPATRPDPKQAWMKPFLGWTESGILLGAVNLLFIVFVIIQVRYLFGGAANINETGFTYSEYARRGFGELVGVAVLSLLLFLCLSTITRLEKRSQRIAFSGLIILLMINVLVILASSLQRLMLYEDAYGFSQLRTVTHVFILWLAALVVTTGVLEGVQQRGRFALALLITVIGFSASLVFVNVDGFTARRNIERAAQGEDLDLAYLNSLSSDAVPVMVKAYQDQTLPADLRTSLGTVLACKANSMQQQGNTDWRSYHFGIARAEKLLQENLPVGHDDKNVRMQRGNLLEGLGRPDLRGLQRRNPMLRGQLLDGTGFDLQTPTGRTVRLGDNTDQLDAGSRGQPAQNG